MSLDAKELTSPSSTSSPASVSSISSSSCATTTDGAKGMVAGATKNFGELVTCTKQGGAISACSADPDFFTFLPAGVTDFASEGRRQRRTRKIQRQTEHYMPQHLALYPNPNHSASCTKSRFPLPPSKATTTHCSSPNKVHLLAKGTAEIEVEQPPASYVPVGTSAREISRASRTHGAVARRMMTVQQSLAPTTRNAVNVYQKLTALQFMGHHHSPFRSLL